MNVEKRHIQGLSVIVIAGHEEHNIASCLESVSWADEIIVVVSQQEDATMTIAREYTPNVTFRSFDSYAAQKQYALGLVSHEWVLSLDADERVTPELREEILAVLAEERPADGYTIPRKNHFRGRWLRHGGWYPDRQLRLFRKSSAHLTDRLVHERFDVGGEPGRLRAPLLHYTLPDIEHMLRKNLSYSLYTAREKVHRRRITILDFLLRPPLEFAKKYFLQRGFLDGWEGFIVALIHSSNKLHVLLRLWEMQYRGENTGDRR